MRLGQIYKAQQDLDSLKKKKIVISENVLYHCDLRL